MLGGGNPVGSNPAGTGTGINYIGKHAYAYSGTVGVTNAEKKMLKFATGNEYIVAEFNLSCNSGAGDDFDFIIRVNGESILESQITTPAQPGSRFINPIKLILPAFSNIEATLENVTQASSLDWTVTMVGRVYN